VKVPPTFPQPAGNDLRINANQTSAFMFVTQPAGKHGHPMGIEGEKAVEKVQAP